MLINNKLVLDTLTIIRNIRFYNYCSEECIEFVIDYKPRAVDRVLVTYPECGTAWAQRICHLIINSGSIDENHKSFFNKYWIQYTGQQTLQYQKWERDSEDVFLIKTHLSYDLLPFNKSAKYLLVLRNPKDVVLSYYEMLSTLYNLNIDFHQFFKLWIRGYVPFGDYFEFVKQYWIHCKTEHNFSFLVYEEMKRNIKQSIETIAEFLGQKYVNRFSNDNKLMDKVIEKSNIKSMKGLHTNGYHLRKGIVGDWRSVLTKEESDLIDKRVEEEWMGTGLEFVWKEDMEWINNNNLLSSI